MAAVGFGAAGVSVAARQGETASCSGMIGQQQSSSSTTVAGGQQQASSGRGVASAMRRVGAGAAARGGRNLTRVRAAAAAGASVGSSLRFGCGSAGGAAIGGRHHRRRGDRGLRLVTGALAVNKATKSIDEMDPEHVNFASQDELDHRCVRRAVAWRGRRNRIPPSGCPCAHLRTLPALGTLQPGRRGKKKKIGDTTTRRRKAQSVPGQPRHCLGMAFFRGADKRRRGERIARWRRGTRRARRLSSPESKTSWVTSFATRGEPASLLRLL